MHAGRVALAACVVPLAVACSSPSEPSAVPDVRGSWGAAQAWVWSEDPTYRGATWHTSPCAGRIDITAQTGASFSGRYAITCPASASSGAVVDGRVGPNGELSFELKAEQGWEPGIPPGMVSSCALSGDSSTYEGALVNGAISVTRFQKVDCPAVGLQVRSVELQVASSFFGSRL